MVEDGTPLGGASGAPEQAADSSRDEGLLSSLEPGKDNGHAPVADDAEFLKKLETMDPGALPESLRRKFEAPFLSQFNKKTTDLDLKEKNYLNIIDRLTSRTGEAPTKEVQDEIRERVRAGDTEAIEEFINRQIDERVQARTGPQMEMLSRKNAIDEAARLMPELPRYEARVAEALKEDPELMRMVAANGYSGASRVLAGLAWREDAMAVRQELQALKASFDAKVQAEVAAYQKKVQGLPPSTSQAGKTPTATTSNDTPSLRDAMSAAWDEKVGGS